ncbi:male accessory gland serine protease inhibitor-like [Drosophila eugracilis]|uniref:male accessory gland serine protease inhibitor-like n=1 Tax=Drosophila eugracilis TaxID=29029 RepID=UPI001BD9B232|nr:male accessory gland serine protease inhibitor-like [Drosophila eugracilis]
MKYFAVVVLLCCLLGAALAQLKNPVCGEEQSRKGHCRGLIPKWTYSQEKNECIVFNFSGCKGNNNNFNSKEECEQTCKN